MKKIEINYGKENFIFKLMKAKDNVSELSELLNDKDNTNYLWPITQLLLEILKEEWKVFEEFEKIKPNDPKYQNTMIEFITKQMIEIYNWDKKNN